MAAGPFVQAPEPGRLSERQPQSGHFKELRANSANEFVHNHLTWRSGEQNAVHERGATRPLAKSRVTACFRPVSRRPQRRELTDSRQIRMTNIGPRRKCLRRA